MLNLVLHEFMHLFFPSAISSESSCVIITHSDSTQLLFCLSLPLGGLLFKCSGFYLFILNNSWRIKAVGCLYAGIAVYFFFFASWVTALSSKEFGLVLAVFLSFWSVSLLLLMLFKVHSAATSLAADLLKYHTDHMILKALKITGVEGNLEAVAEYTCKLSEQKEQLVEVSSQLFWFFYRWKWIAGLSSSIL